MTIPQEYISTAAVIKKFILDLLFPGACVGCGQLSDRMICSVCRASVSFQFDLCCAFCYAPTVGGVTCPFDREAHALSQLLVAFSYQDRVVERAIKACKYNYMWPVGEELGEEMAEYLAKQVSRLMVELDHTVIVPVPLSGHRLRWRGFNQAEVLARRIAQRSGLSLCTVLARTTRHPWYFFSPDTPQADITSRADRIRNITGLFSCPDPMEIIGKTILLIDDISTTGSTLDECARVLRAAGARKVIGFVVARGI